METELDASKMSALDVAAPRKPCASEEPPGRLRPPPNYPDDFHERVAEPVALPQALPAPAPREIPLPGAAPNQLAPCLYFRNSLPA